MRRVTCSHVLRTSLCVLAYSLLVIGLTYWVYIEAAPGAPERAARARCCTLCHGEEWSQRLHPDLRQHKSGEPIRPVLAQALLRRHENLSKGAEDDLTEWLVSQQLPQLAAAHRQSPGTALYLAKCAACHGRHGEGQPGNYPPLVGSEWLTEEPSRLPDILTHGLRGPIVVKGEPWNAIMLPPGLNSAEDVQAVIHYIRKQFSH